MEVLAAPGPQLAWICPECGHGSPEPRDRQAHLDAHRQLRTFIDDWDAAAAREAAQRRHRPLYVGAALLAVAVLAALAVWDAGRRTVVGPDAGEPAPVVQLPSQGAPPVPPAVTPRAAPSPTPSAAPPSTVPPRASRAAGPFPTVPAGNDQPPPSVPPAAATSVTTVAPASAGAPSGQALLVLRGCVLNLVCLDTGG